MQNTVSFSKNATNLFFHILTQCNLKCAHCYINPEQHGHTMLPIETIYRWLLLFQGKCAQTDLIFLGGEPTLHPKLPEAIRKASQIGFKSITIDTNGYLFHDILIKITPQMVSALSFSLDGATQKTNDHSRGKGCFDTCIKGIQEAVSLGFTTSLIYTVSNFNIHELDLMPELLTRLGIRNFFIQVIGLRGRSQRTNAPLQVDKKVWEKTVPVVAKKIAAKGINVTYPKVFLPPETPFECAGLVADNYFVFPNGRVYRCPICEDYPINSLIIQENQLVPAKRLNENDFFRLNIPEGCVMNKLIQPANLTYDQNGNSVYKVACCLLKEERLPLS